jgi:hypothetical protein
VPIRCEVGVRVRTSGLFGVGGVMFMRCDVEQLYRFTKDKDKAEACSRTIVLVN